jgi:hypothetical protein
VKRPKNVKAASPSVSARKNRLRRKSVNKL